MKKNFYLVIFLFLWLPNVLAGAPYPKRFTWLPGYSLGGTPYYDQKVQGPCNCFASTQLAESWYRLLYGTYEKQAVQQLYSQCASAGPESTDIFYSLLLMRDSGIVDDQSLVYGNSVTNTLLENKWFANQLKVNANFPCKAPHQWNSQNSAANFLYYVSDFQKINFDTMYTSLGLTGEDRLKRILLNYGPVALNFNSHVTDSFHSGTAHAYVLYGWDTTANSTATTWYFTDSWPGSSVSNSRYKGDFLAFIKNTAKASLLAGPFILKPGKDVNGNITNDAVYKKNTSNNGVTWNKVTLAKPANDITTLLGNLGISINGKPSATPSQYIAGAIPMTIENISQFDNYTIQWSYVADSSVSPNAGVTISSPSSATTNVSYNGQGYVKIKALITLSNGIAISVTRRIYTCAGIPFLVTKTYDNCIGSTRLVKWQVQSRMAEPLPSTISINWNFMPSGGSPTTYYSTYAITNDIFNINYANLSTSTSYGLIVGLTDAGYNNYYDQSTNGGFESPCVSHFMATTGKTVSPNPARSSIIVSVPSSSKTLSAYTVNIIDMTGKVLLSRRVTGTSSIDVSKFARGVYTVQFIPTSKREKPEVQKVVLN